VRGRSGSEETIGGYSADDAEDRADAERPESDQYLFGAGEVAEELVGGRDRQRERPDGAESDDDDRDEANRNAEEYGLHEGAEGSLVVYGSPDGYNALRTRAPRTLVVREGETVASAAPRTATVERADGPTEVNFHR
jgi:hypothetical protein